MTWRWLVYTETLTATSIGFVMLAGVTVTVHLNPTRVEVALREPRKNLKENQVTEPSYTAADALLHVAAGVERLTNMVTQTCDSAPDTMTRAQFAEQVLAWLAETQRTVDEHRHQHGGYGERYSTGIPVSSVVEAAAAGYRYEKIWHPDPAHFSNRSRVLAEGVEFSDGVLVDVIVAAPGVLDLVHRKSP
ncbi:hypothetical protein KN246_15815 [Mycobacterium intracellulare]|uniref:hypothetical protein n=1 Tax=Mycobacterium intracellulare TaxID=1767 RepID=UPI001E332781|nr:hypothetical protein [Mycobacterium intracellulare]UGT94856.1 hypothetical protein LTQ55_13735 [Mycobacterium intracellulare]UQB95732.1 hypothetical protein KN246_15815 [Mycobacterium intracellulare]